MGLDLEDLVTRFAKMCALPREEAAEQEDLCAAALRQVEVFTAEGHMEALAVHPHIEDGDDVLDDLSKRQCNDRQIVAAQPKHRYAYQKAHNRRGSRTDQQCQEKPYPARQRFLKRQ